MERQERSPSKVISCRCFLCSLMFIGWYGGVKPSLLARALSLRAFKYYFVTPLHSLIVKTREIPRLLIFSLALVAPGVVAQTPVQTTRTIRVVVDNAYAPYSFQSDDGKLQGILTDQWQAWEKKTGIKVGIYAMDWDEALRRTRAGEAAAAILLIAGLVGWNRTLRKRILQRTAALRESEQRFRQIAENLHSEDRLRLVIDTIPTMAWSLRPDGVLDFVNQRWLDYTGLSLEEEIEEPTRAVHPEDLSRVMEKWIAEMAAGEPGEDEMRLRRADGEYRWFLVRTVPLRDEQGNIVKWYGVSTDIDDRKLAEGTLRQSEFDLAEAQRVARLGSWSFDIATNTVRWSEELYRVFDVDKTAFGGTYEAFLSRVHPDDRTRVLQVNAEARSSGKPFEVEYRITTRGGQLKHIREVGYARKDRGGAVSGLFGTAQDITERKRAEEQLQTTTEQLRALSARLSSVREEEGARIARALHDELGSALSSLKWSLEGMDTLCSEASPQIGASKLREKIAGMIELIDTTIDTVRRISSELRPIMLDELDIVAAIEWQAQQFQARTGILCPVDALVEKANVSREQAIAVYRILQEALTNVLRHAQASRVNILVNEEAGELVLEVRDNGRGITEEEKTTTRSLGLMGMRERAHMIGGRIEITGGAGQGTVVILRVPISK